MSASASTRAAKAAPVSGTAVRNAAPERARATHSRPKLPGNQSLLRVQRKCSCSGTCSACQLKQRLGIQTKVAVGPVDDPFEREADHVAAHVMRMPRGGGEAGASGSNTSSNTSARIQRTCQACAAARDDEQLRRRAAPNTSHASSRTELELSPTVLTYGGHSLSAPVRDFFESRFGRDFSAVRVHQGPVADRANDALSAHAFTYGHHIWLGRGQAPATTPLLAHELAHVVQQTAPRRVTHSSPGHAHAAAHGAPALRDHANAVRRSITGIPYFEPERRTGTGTHSEILPLLRLTPAGSAGGEDLFIEAPVPNANEHGAGYGRTGRADLYAATTTVGVFYNGHNVPMPLNARGTRRNGGAYSHATEAAPRLATRFSGTVTNTANAPTSVRVGDLKPLWERAFMGRGQLQSYRQGFEMAHRETNQLSPAVRDGAWAPLSTGILNDPDVAVPNQYQPPFNGQSGENLVLKMAGALRPRVLWRPNPPIPGRLAVRADPNNAGIWNYFWVPQTSVPTASLPTNVQRLGPEVTRDIVDPLLQDPIQARPKRRPHAPTKPGLTGDAAGPVVRRAPLPNTVRDPFDYDRWRSNHQRLTQNFGTAERSRDFAESAGRLKAIEALEILRDRSGLASAIPHVPDTGRQAQHELNRVDFWTGLSARPFGLMRRIFGRAFVAVARFYIRIRNRFRELLNRRRMRSGAPSGALGAALKAAFTVLKMATRFLIGRVVDRLWTSLTTGVMNKIQSLIPAQITDELQDRIDQVTQLRDELERRALDSIEGWIHDVIGPYEDEIRQIEEVHRIVSDITTIINLVRWGARAVACLSPPALGCLWLIGEAALDMAAQAVVQTCWFQRKITPLIAGIDFIRSIPNRLAQIIVDKIRVILPSSLHDIFADIPDVDSTVRAGDVECEPEPDEAPGARYAYGEQAQAIMEMQETLGEEKFQAFLALAQAADMGNLQPSPAELRALTAQLDNLSPEQLQAFARQYPNAPSDVPTDFATAVRDYAQRAQGGTAPQTLPPTADSSTAGPDTTPTPPPQAPPTGGGSTPTPRTGAGGSTSGDGAGGGTVPTVPASTRVFRGTSPGPLHGSLLDILNARAGHTQGTRVTLDILESFNHAAEIIVTDVPAIVARRRFFPVAAGEGNASHIIIHYQLLQGVRLARGVLTEGRTICYYYPWGTGERRFAGTRQCPQR